MLSHTTAGGRRGTRTQDRASSSVPFVTLHSTPVQLTIRVPPLLAGVGMLLLEAARQGQAQLVKLLLGADVSPFFSDHNADTALIIAARAQNSEVCKVLVEVGHADLEVFNQFRVNAFDVALMNKNVETLQALKPTDLNDISKMTKLMYVTYCGGIGMVKPLIEIGVDVRKATESGASAITVAAEKGDVEILDFLLSRNKDLVEDERYEKRTPLLLAAQNGRGRAVECLLKHKADPTKCRKGMCAIHLAAQYGHAEVLQVLFGHGQVGVDSESGPSTLKPKAQSASQTPSGPRASSTPPDLQLSSSFANLGEVTPLMMASRYGHLEATTVLIEQRADVNKGDLSGWTSKERTPVPLCKPKCLLF